jgi:hypothetical protein
LPAKCDTIAPEALDDSFIDAFEAVKPLKQMMDEKPKEVT